MRKKQKTVPHYYYDVNFHHRDRKWRRAKRRLYIFVVLVIVVFVVVLVDIVLGLIRSSKPTQPTSETSQSYILALQTFRTPFFEFKAGKDWQAIAKESTATKYVYRSLNGNFVKHEITVYVNDKTAATTEATRVIPVSISVAGKIMPEVASNHCKEGFPKITAHFPIPITYDGVTFTCNPDSNNYVAVVGKTGGNTEIMLKRPGGSMTTYGFIYRALQSTPDDGQARKILESFKPL
jgi:hypothetical protein